MGFDHERFDCYRLAVEVARWMRKTRFPRGDADLRRQAVRAADSVVPNIAEGTSRKNDAAKNHLRIALASAGETCAALEMTSTIHVHEHEHEHEHEHDDDAEHDDEHDDDDEPRPR